MSQTDTEDLREFVEELASMARTGQSLSIVSGFHMAWWGGAVAVACLAHLIAIAEAFPFKIAYIWPVTMLIGWLGSIILQRKLNLFRRHGALAYVNRVTRYVWFGIGLASTLVILMETSQLADFAGRGYFIIFLLCGLGLVTTSAAGSEPLLLLSGIGWFLFGFASLFFPPTTQIIYGVSVIASVILLILPGLIIGIRKA